MTSLLPSPARRAAGALAAIAALLALGGCWNPFSPKVLGRGVSTQAPVPNSPSNTLGLFEWAYENRAFPEYREVFTADYRFVFSASDSAGAQYRDVPWTRDDELESARNLFEGGDVNQPAASQITLLLDPTLRELPDDRPGKNSGWHRMIRTNVNLNITDVGGTSTNVYGKAKFYFVRGDSADIPADLGLAPDPNRWYMDRWEDETLNTGLLTPPDGGGGSAVLAPGAGGPSTAARLAASRGPATPATAGTQASLTSWGSIKAWYR